MMCAGVGERGKEGWREGGRDGEREVEREGGKKEKRKEGRNERRANVLFLKLHSGFYFKKLIKLTNHWQI